GRGVQGGVGPRRRLTRNRRRQEIVRSHRTRTVGPMSTYVVRIWIPDRPGALGAVASRIGSVRGDLIGIDILERGAGLAIDELVIELPDNSLVPLLTAEVAEVDGVDVEHVHEVVAPLHDARLDALLTASLLVQQ